MDIEPELQIVDWTILPHFLKQGIESFPFDTTQSAQIFSDLLVARIRCLLLQPPCSNDTSIAVAKFIDLVFTEMVNIFLPCLCYYLLHPFTYKLFLFRRLGQNLPEDAF
jgi:hypothetical protein